MQLIFDNISGEGDTQLDVLRSICGDTSGKSMIDIGCGFAPTTRRLGFSEKIFIDIVQRDLAEENDNFLHQDILKLVNVNFPAKSDVSICLDAIEHFWEPDARKVIAWMEANSHKQIIFTPLGYYLNVDDKKNTDPDTHKSGWTPAMLPGYACIIFPQFHPTLSEGGLGAFFAFKCENLQAEFKRVSNELKEKSKSWIRFPK